MNDQSFSKIWIIIILIALISGGILSYQFWWVPKQKAVPEGVVKDKTADWKVYRNERYQYEIKYPPELDMGEEEFERQGVPAETAQAIIWMFPARDTLNIAISVTAEVQDNLEKKPLLSVLGYDPAFCKIEKEQDTFLKISCEMEEGALQMIESAYSRNDRVYIISLIIVGLEDLTKMDFASEISTYNLMLSTFKFLEGEVIVPPQRSAKDVKVIAAMIQMGTAAEIFYSKNGSYLNLGTDEDVSYLRKQIQNEIGRWPGMITSDDAYCVDVTLSDGKTKYCIDSEGRRGENLGCSSTKLICIGY